MTSVEKLYYWFNISLGLPVVIEALALFIGMNILVSERVEWATLKNNFILSIDIVTGIGILYISFFKKEHNLSIVFYGLLFIILISHLYREIEFFTKIPVKFAHNTPLFIVNSIKFLLSVGCLGLGLYLKRVP